MMHQPSNVSVYHTPAQVPDLHGLVVVIDVLRATSTMTMALANGCKAIYPVATVSKALELADILGRQKTLVGGERGGKRVEGFDLGNSPAEYTRRLVDNKDLVLTTTNGTLALQHGQSATLLLALSFLNLDVVIRTILDTDPMPVHIICAGTDGQFSLEDSVCAGVALKRLMQGGRDRFRPGDGTHQALDLAEQHESDILNMLQVSMHGQRLIGLGFEQDLILSSQMNQQSVLPGCRPLPDSGQPLRMVALEI
ncbi:2-phosphosulfolactate phosphatase [candidate division KSB1 bacterium]|nr:2-phosphosulfolactate phosphatase [candidate division KSB1 bacterium]